MADREVHIGDLYYNDTTRSLFVVTERKPNFWILHNGDGLDRVLSMPLGQPSPDWVYLIRPNPDFKVTVGSLWYALEFKGLHRVVRYNDNREAGPDSWEMLDEVTGKILYMHHNQRVQGEWLYVGEPEISEPTPVVHRSRYHRTPVI